VGTITLIGIAVLVGTALSLNRPGASNAKNVGTKDAEVTAPLPPTYVTAPPAALVNDELVYNVRTPSKLAADQTLKGAVDGAVALAVSKGFKAENLSITLIDLKSNRFADHYGQILRYPASVAKLFWIMMAFAQIEQGILKPDAALNSDLKAAAVISDNDAASRIIDRISQTQSGPELTGAEFTTWMDKRFRMNNFFKQSGFEGLSLIHKNYPVYSLDMESPTGRDAQLVAQKDGDKSLRNSASTDQAARAMYEIYNRLAVSAKYSDEMIALLKRDLRPEVWKKDTLNCVAGFLGEYLPPDTIFAGKIGYTTQTRHEVAFIETPDRKTAYVLAVFGESPEFSASTTILPEISKHIYLKMTGKNPQPQPSVSPSPSPNGEV
jgi:beta-lactamase class A